jgi:hypothetical protein
MSLLYKPKELQTLKVNFTRLKYGSIQVEFESDCGKHGTDEMIAGYVLTPERLLQILQERDDFTDNEL